MTPDQLRRVIPSMADSTAREAAAAINAACIQFGIDQPLRQAHFTVQALHESLGFTRMVENLNYTPEALRSIWPNRFTPETARLYGRVDGVHPANQQMIANVAYANRMGNGSIESGDGWRYRGRGPGQLTGKSNYLACGRELGLDLVRFPDQVAQILAGCMAFGWFWKTHGLNKVADGGAGAMPRVRAVVNGGDLGLQACEDLFGKTLEALA